MTSSVRRVELLLITSTILTWFDFVPRILAMPKYPVNAYSSLPASFPWPASIAPQVGLVLFVLAGCSLVLFRLRYRWLMLFATLAFTQSLAIYWSFFGSASHGSQLPLLALWTLAIFRLGKSMNPGPWIMSLQILIGLMFMSAAYFKWTTSGVYWAAGYEMQRRIFVSYSVDGIAFPFFLPYLMSSTSLATISGIVELLAQSACLPLIVASFVRPKMRFLAGLSAVVAAAGIHLGMNLFCFQFFPLSLVLLVPLKKQEQPTRANLQTLGFAAIVALCIATAFYPKGNLSRKVFPLTYYPMYSTSGYPLKVVRLRTTNYEALGPIQKEFFHHFGKHPLDEHTIQFAQAHGVAPEKLITVSYTLKSFRENPTSLSSSPAETKENQKQ